MAAGHDIPTLKREAMAKMAQGREGLDHEVQRLRTELSPSRMVSKVTDRHPLAVLGGIFGVGLLLPLLIFRSRLPVVPEVEGQPLQVPVKNWPTASLLSRAVSLSMPHLIRFVANKFLLAHATEPPESPDQAAPSESAM